MSAEHHRAAAKLIEDNISSLPGANGVQLRLMGFSTHGRTPEHAQKINQARRETAEAIIRLLADAGYRISR